MPRKDFHNVYLYDNYPSDISAVMTIRESIWNIVSTIESNYAVDESITIHSTDTDDLRRMKDLHDLPMSFGHQPPTKKAKRQNKKKGIAKGMNQRFTEFSETKSAYNLYMGYNQGDGMSYPCRVLGVGPRSCPEREFSVVQFIGYGTVAELERAVSLRCVPVDRVIEINEFVVCESLHRAMGGIEALQKYYDQRFRLFSRFDQRVLLDNESWFSITPECISFDIADKCRSQALKRGAPLGVVLDCFCGVGGNVISLAARAGCRVVCAVDIDASKLAMLRNNAKIYGVSDKVECVHDDAYNILATLSQHKRSHSTTTSQLLVPSETAEAEEASLIPAALVPGVVDVLVLAPPWGGIDYTSTNSAFSLRTMISSGDGMALFHIAAKVCPNIVYILPKNTKKRDLLQLGADSGLFCRVEDVHIHNKLKMIVAYYGPLFSA